MPTVLRERGFRFFFYADDRTEPRHVHVQREARTAKFWLDRLNANGVAVSVEVSLWIFIDLIAQRRELLLQKWHDFFGEQAN